MLNAFVIIALILAASYVYKIKFDSTLRVERAAKLRMEIRREHDAIAALRAQWARLETPGRIQGLAERHLKIQPTKPQQYVAFDKLPPRPPQPEQTGGDAISSLIDIETPTGSIAAEPGREQQ
jgi:hypothetical protein